MSAAADDSRQVDILCLAVLLAATVPLPARAAPKFLAYEGKNAIHDGQGGDKQTVDGVDFWSDGDPPHKFQVLGSLTDRRHQSGIYGAIRMSDLDKDIAKAARAAGGDAVILQSEESEVIGEARAHRRQRLRRKRHGVREREHLRPVAANQGSRGPVHRRQVSA